MRFTINASQPMNIMAASELLFCCLSALDIYLFLSLYFTLCPLFVVCVYTSKLICCDGNITITWMPDTRAMPGRRNEKRINTNTRTNDCGIHNASKHKHISNWIGRLLEHKASWIINYVDKNRSDIKLVSYSVCVRALHTTTSTIIRHLRRYFLFSSFTQTHLPIPALVFVNEKNQSNSINNTSANQN